MNKDTPVLIEHYNKLINKPYEVGEVIWINGIVGQELKLYRTKFEITEIGLLDGELVYIGRPDGFASQHYVLPCMIDGYAYTCPVCGNTGFIKGSCKITQSSPASGGER